MSAPQPDLNRDQGRSNTREFARWRPSFHLIAPHSWLNDPCGPGYDPSTGKYHVAYQWNPKDNDWGNISWGRATSSDLVSWDVDTETCLVPAESYDSKGIFTGCFLPTNLHGKQDGTLTYFYTSVSQLPIHFTLPYSPGCETLSIAVSQDSGRTWQRHSQNPILLGPPSGVSVTAWRDPYVFSWPSAPEKARGLHGGKDVLYGLISGGIRDRTPTTFLYAIERERLTEWHYLGDLINTSLNFTPSRWSGDYGKNWEVTNLVTLVDDDGESRDFLIMGTEGCMADSQCADKDQTPARERRIQRSQLWMCIKENTEPSTSSPMEYAFGGIFDSGLFYAANSFWDPVAEQQVVFGWITEEDLPDDVRKEQGWSGLISLPRIPKLQTLRRVKRARTTPRLNDITSIEAIPDGDGTYTVRTLGVGLDPRVKKLRETAKETTVDSISLGILQGSASSQPWVPMDTTRWEIEAEIAVGKNCRQVGLTIYHDSDRKFRTVLFWDPFTETFQIDRPDLSDTPFSRSNINHGPEVAPHTLFTTVNKTSDSRLFGLLSTTTETETEEPLRIRALFDGSVLEVLVNDRTIITTRIYLAGEDGRSPCADLEFYAVPLESTAQEEAPARLLHATVWDGLATSGSLHY
ncbi:glycosyl hydrolase [Aspergillus egyptiacus]|nr:glycosyl hydrolase [Aspergillus egyptiacus]